MEMHPDSKSARVTTVIRIFMLFSLCVHRFCLGTVCGMIHYLSRKCKRSLAHTQWISASCAHRGGFGKILDMKAISALFTVIGETTTVTLTAKG